MSQLKRFLPVALLGLQQAPSVPRADGLEASLFDGVTPEQSPERFLLQQIGVISLCEQAGWLLPAWSAAEIEDNIPSPIVTENDKLGALLKALPSNANKLQLEILTALQAVREQIPALAWPLLFNLVGTQRLHYKKLQQLMTPYARWLAKQNPAWQALALGDIKQPKADADWYEGNKQTRLNYFEALRQRDTEQALALLEQEDKNIKAAEKAELINLLTIPLNHADLVYLHRQLQHRAESVRLASRDLLRQCPDSEYGQTLKTLLQQQLKPIATKGLLAGLLDKKPKIQLAWPEDLTTLAIDWAALAINTEPQQAKAKGMSVQEHVLQQIVAGIPLTFWQDYYQASPNVLLESAMASTWADGLLRGWLEQMLLSKDTHWIKAALNAPAKLKKRLLTHTPEANLLSCLQAHDCIALLWDFNHPPQGQECFIKLATLVYYLPDDFYFTEAESRSLMATIEQSATAVAMLSSHNLHWQASNWFEIAGFFASSILLETAPTLAHFANSVDRYLEWLAWRKNLQASMGTLFFKTTQEPNI